MTFKQLKEEILKRAKSNDACADEYRKACRTKNKKELLKVLIDNFDLGYANGTIDVGILDGFGNSMVNKAGVYYKGKYDKIEGEAVVALCGDVYIGVLDSSTVQNMRDSSTVQAMWNSSTVQTMWNNSTVLTMQNSSTVQTMWGNSISRSYNGNLPESMEDRCTFVDLKNDKVYCGLKKGRLTKTKKA